MRSQAEFACSVAGKRVSRQPSTRAELEAIARPLVDRTHRRGAPGRCATPRSRRPRSTASSWSAARPACRWCAGRSHELFGRAPLTDLDPDQVVALGAARPGRCARRQRRRRRPAAARRDAAVARHRDDGRPGRAHRPAQQPDPDCAGAGVHHLPGRPDGDGDPRRAGRARAGRRLPLAGALRAARHSADGRRRGADQGHLHGRCRRPARASPRARRPPGSRPS